jgi:hypothetical protein
MVIGSPPTYCDDVKLLLSLSERYGNPSSTRGDTGGYETWTKVAYTIRTLKQSGYKSSRNFR